MRSLYNIFHTSYLLLFILAMVKPDAHSQSVFPEDAWGVYSWTQFTQIDKNSAPLVKGGPIIIRWANLEPQNGVYEFESEIRDKLTKALNNDFYVFLKIYFAGPSSSGYTPEWIYSNGVPKVSTSRGVFPYYFDDDYKFYYYRMIAEFGAYVLSLPDSLKDRILFIQCTEGSTGDGYCYKGDPTNPDYDISREQWVPFRLEAWKKFKAAFSENGILQIPLLTNDDANTPELRNWMLAELPMAIGVKNGMFTHGYQISDAQERLANHFALKEQAEAAGKVFFARGEMDAEMNEKGWITQNKKQGLYWSAIYATHCGITMWNIIQDAVKGYEYQDAIEFFNTYAGQLNPETANGAFCAFYRGLDASDVTAFPENIYGTAIKSNQQRYINICDAFSQYGANMADAAAATGGGMANRDASGYNDAGWQILKENFQRHITQIDPEETSAAWWQVDASVYGRFARSFEHSSGKDTMYFDIDDHFFGSNQTGQKSNLTFKVTYLASDAGSWSLKYHALDGTMKTALSVTNSGSGWETKEVTIDGALLNNGGPKGADFILENNGGTDCRFHMVEIDKSQIVYGSVTRCKITAGAGPNGYISPDGEVLVIEGKNQHFTMMANDGYEVEDVLVDSVSQGPVTSYTFNNVTTKHTIHATFKERTSSPNLITNGDFSDGTTFWYLNLNGTSSATLGNESGEGFVDITGDDGTNWHVSLEYGGIHLINGHNYTLTFDARAQADRDIILKCKPDGGAGENSFGNSRKSITNSPTNVSHNWTHETLTGAYALQIFCGAEGTDNDVWFDNFELVDNTGVQTYIITASADSNGSINPGGAVLVNEFENQSFTITPDSGYEVDDVTVDGNSEGAITSYSFSNITADHSINATFKKIQVTHIITASAGANGTISPDGDIVVNEGENQIFTFIPDNGYEIDDISVDGVSMGAISSYTFNNIMSNHTIIASFKETSTSTKKIHPEEVSHSKSKILKSYPNPFSTITTISYQLAKQGHVNLRAYNICGLEIATLFNGYQTKGIHEHTWEAIDSYGNPLQNGIYFIRLEAGNMAKTIKVMLMK